MQIYQFINEIIHSLSGLDQQDDPPGLLQLGHHVFQGLGSDYFGALGLVAQEVVDLGHRSVVGADLLDGDRLQLEGEQRVHREM